MFRSLFHRKSGEPQAWLDSPRGPIRRERSPTGEALARWKAYREAFSATGLWPVIVPLGHAASLEEGFARQAGEVETNVARGERLDLQECVARRSARATAILAADGEEFRPDLGFDPAAHSCEARPPVEGQIAATNGQRSLNGSQRGVWIALVPCSAPWEVPAVLGYGSWNDCPSPAEHVAFLREWHARHGAEPLVFGKDTLELLVRPIADPMEAKRAALEHLAYDVDVLSQDAEAVRGRAAEILGAAVWLFWWD